MTKLKKKKRPTMKKKKIIKQIKESAIPSNILNKFLAERISKEDNKYVFIKECSSVGKDRYRLDVWLKKHQEGFYCPKMWIAYSYYVQYSDGKIIDKTIPMKPSKDKIF